MNIGYYSMGNSVLDGRMSAVNSDCTITKFYTSAAWIEGRAEQQLEHVADGPASEKSPPFLTCTPESAGPLGVPYWPIASFRS